jgi:hypothetical protein
MSNKYTQSQSLNFLGEGECFSPPPPPPPPPPTPPAANCLEEMKNSLEILEKLQILKNSLEIWALCLNIIIKKNKKKMKQQHFMN